MSEETWKAEFNARAKASMRAHLRAKSWPEKVDSIARMNREMKVAQQAMREALAKKQANAR